MPARFNYLELPTSDVPGAKAFYAAAFGLAFTDFGPDYASTMTGDTDRGLNGDAAQATAQLLPVIQVDDLEATEAAVRGAGGVITLPIFAGGSTSATLPATNWRRWCPIRNSSCGRDNPLHRSAQRSVSRGMSSTKLHGLCRLSS